MTWMKWPPNGRPEIVEVSKEELEEFCYDMKRLIEKQRELLDKIRHTETSTEEDTD